MGTQQSGNGAGTRNRMTGCQSGRDTFPVNPLDPVDQPSGPCGPTLWTLWANPLDPVGQPSGPCGPTLWTLWTNPLDGCRPCAPTRIGPQGQLGGCDHSSFGGVKSAM